MTDQDYKPLEETLSFNEARRRKEIYTAEIARVEALRIQGLYVEKNSVYSALSSFGISIRNRLQAIPDRYIDNIINAENRFEAHEILTNAIYDALTELQEDKLVWHLQKSEHILRKYKYNGSDKNKREIIKEFVEEFTYDLQNLIMKVDKK